MTLFAQQVACLYDPENLPNCAGHVPALRFKRCREQ